MPNSARSRGEINPSLNSRLNSSWVRTFPCPLPLTFITFDITSFQHLTRYMGFV
jgi:hypothetical protein